MSVSTEVQRTLVKSPPELWAELGSVEGLARQLGEVGEIRFVKVEPESRVEWEADLVSGVVELKQSGWGTKVTLSLTRELPASESEVPAEAEAVSQHEENQADPIAEYESIAEAEPSESGEPESVVNAAAMAEPKQGFFARLFKRRKAAEAQAEPGPVAITKPEPPLELHAMAWPEPIYPEPPPKPVEPEPDLAAELAELEAQLQQESTELLTRVLDRLGAAHHRPFSRA